MQRAWPLLVLCLAWLSSAPSANAYQLLFLPLSERTHMLVHLQLATELSSRNHSVYFITGDCLASFAEETAARMAPGARLHFIQYSLDCEHHERAKAAARLLNPLGEVAAIYKNVVGRADALLSDAALMQQLAALAPATDLLVGDVFSFGMLLASKLQLPHVDLDVGTAGPLWEPAMYGAEAGAAFVPAVGTFLPTDGMALWQRALNLAATTVMQAAVRAAFWHPRAALQRVIARHGLPQPWPYTKALLLLVNSNFATEPPRAVAPNTQYVGPLMPQPAQQLPPALGHFVDAAGPRGVVLISFGGTLQPPLAASRTLAAAMRGLPDVAFVWKLARADQAALAAEGTPLADLANVFVDEWLPQNDLLGHSRVRAFVTQGGYLSMSEAAYHGVPVVGLPFIPGQGELIRFAQDQGRAVRLPADSLVRGRSSTVTSALLAVLTEESYHAAAARVSERLRAARRPYRQVAADWVEYAAALRGHQPFLHPQKLHLAWHQQAMLDVLALYATAATAALWLCYRWLWWQSWRLAAAVSSCCAAAAGWQRRRQLCSVQAEVVLAQEPSAAGKKQA
jgi:UDP:flavonoid glycosyltransferase YjiC (YdhE family)